MLPLDGVTLESVSVRSDVPGVPEGELRTYWQLSDLDVALGLDYTAPGRQFARFTHLQHRPFHYELSVSRRAKQCTLNWLG